MASLRPGPPSLPGTYPSALLDSLPPALLLPIPNARLPSPSPSCLPTPLQDLAHSIVSRLVDASQPPSAWELPLLARPLYALVNQTALDEPVDFRGGFDCCWVLWV